VYSLNPVAGLLDTARWVMIDGPGPGVRVALGAATTLLALAFGVWTFARNERRFADMI
jgi:ABC-type polysaccharide/polyol phosphate export permease